MRRGGSGWSERRSGRKLSRAARRGRASSRSSSGGSSRGNGKRANPKAHARKTWGKAFKTIKRLNALGADFDRRRRGLLPRLGLSSSARGKAPGRCSPSCSRRRVAAGLVGQRRPRRAAAAAAVERRRAGSARNGAERDDEDALAKHTEAPLRRMRRSYLRPLLPAPLPPRAARIRPRRARRVGRDEAAAELQAALDAALEKAVPGVAFGGGRRLPRATEQSEALKAEVAEAKARRAAAGEAHAAALAALQARYDDAEAERTASRNMRSPGSSRWSRLRRSSIR